MAVAEIRCPNCGSTSISRNESAYCCDFCGRKFQNISKIQKELALNISDRQQIKYGKITFKIEDAMKLGNFSLDKNVKVTYYMKDIFKFHGFKQIKRGNTIVKADAFGYVFTDPVNGTINDVFFADGFYPTSHDFKNVLLSEYVRIVNDDAFEDKPSIKREGQELEIPSFVSIDKLKKEVFAWLLQNFAVKKRYYVQSGAREAVLTFKKKDILEFGYIGCYAIPLFNLSYNYPNSSRILKRQVLGYSGQIIQDDFKCSKNRMFGKACENFPNDLCSVCANPICNDHQKQCEKCGTIICKDCKVSKGLISKHYFCPKCAR